MRMTFIFKTFWAGLFLAFLSCFIALGIFGLPAKKEILVKGIPNDQLPQ